MAFDPKEYLGTPINASDANDYLQTNAIIKDRIRFFVENTITKNAARINRSALGGTIPEDPERATKALNLCDDQNNVYVFSKEDFLRFFEGDPDPDEPQKNLQFTHCLIVVGSLSAPNGSKKMGEQTLIIAGCTKLDASTYITTADGTLGGISLKKVATEHPPRKYTAKIEDPVNPKFMINRIV